MVPSRFNVRAPLASGDVFLMNTLTDAQFVVSPDVVSLLDAAPDGLAPGDDDVEAARDALAEHGFFVPDHDSERAALETHFHARRTSVKALSVTVLTTMQCNFACEYCIQGDRDGARPGERMSADTAEKTAAWIENELARIRPERLSLTFFGGEPLLNTPAMYLIAERCAGAARRLGVDVSCLIITNGLLLTPEIVERMLPFGLTSVKVTLDGDRDTHDRARPLRGGQGTFDRIVENMRRVAPLVPLAVGGNFDADTADRYPDLLRFLRDQEFSSRIESVVFKPVVQSRPAGGRKVIPLQVAGAASCGSGGPRPGRSICDSCHLADDQMAFLLEETRRHGFPTTDGLHMGPCGLYHAHTHTVGPDGTMYACPGFTGENATPVGHVEPEAGAAFESNARRMESLRPWEQCGDCAFIPVCGGGCAVAAHNEHGDAGAPSCHKRLFESALVNLAASAAESHQGV